MAANFFSAYPLIGVISISFVLTLITTLIYKFTTDQNKMKMIKEELKSIRSEMMNAKNDPNKMRELQNRSMQISMDQFKHGLKPMIITFLPAILAFSFINKTIPSKNIILKFPFNIPKMGADEGFGWLGVYLLSSMIFSAVLRKILKVY